MKPPVVLLPKEKSFISQIPGIRKEAMLKREPTLESQVSGFELQFLLLAMLLWFRLLNLTKAYLISQNLNLHIVMLNKLAAVIIIIYKMR